MVDRSRLTLFSFLYLMTFDPLEFRPQHASTFSNLTNKIGVLNRLIVSHSRLYNVLTIGYYLNTYTPDVIQ